MKMQREREGKEGKENIRCKIMTFSHGWKINLRLSCRVKSSFLIRVEL